MKIRVPQERLFKVLVAPHVSEKSTNMMQDNQYVFRVVPDATKKEIHAAVELQFEVKVSSVNLANYKGKRKGMGNRSGRRVHWKKAYVSLEKGHTIALTGAG